MKVMLAHLLPRDTEGRLFRRNKWPVVMPLYDGRQCPYCASIVVGPHGQRWHQQWHTEDYEPGETPQDEALAAPPDVHEASEPGGYVIGSGPLPASVRGGTDDE